MFRVDDSVVTDGILRTIRDLPGPSDMIVVDSSEMKNRNFDELILLRFKDRFHNMTRDFDQLKSKQAIRATDPTKDCITWDTSPTSLTDVWNDDMFQQDLVFKDKPCEDSHQRLNHLESVAFTPYINNGDRFNEETYVRFSVVNSIIGKLKAHLQKSLLTVIDLWCVNDKWLNAFVRSRLDVRYTCVNPLPSATEFNQKRSAIDNRIEFAAYDYVTRPMTMSYDLVICVGMLHHIWYEDISRLLLHINQSKSKFVLLSEPQPTEYSHHGNNITEGRANTLNLQLPPFQLVPPICAFRNNENSSLSLWKLPLLQKYYDTR